MNLMNGTAPQRKHGQTWKDLRTQSFESQAEHAGDTRKPTTE